MNVRRSKFGVSRLLLIWTVALLGIMAYHWMLWPNAGISFGPLWFVRSKGLELYAGLATLCLLSMLFLFPARPNLLTASVSAAGCVLWCAAGALGTMTVTVPVVVSPETAYTDGFEVVLPTLAEDGRLLSARSVPLAEAEQAADNDGATLLLPADESAVARELQRTVGKSGDFTVNVTIQRLSADRQKVRASFHYSMRTYYYKYEVAGGRVTPIESGYRDPARSTASRYGQRNE